MFNVKTHLEGRKVQKPRSLFQGYQNVIKIMFNKNISHKIVLPSILVYERSNFPAIENGKERRGLQG